jgi:hypothetical protein
MNTDGKELLHFKTGSTDRIIFPALLERNDAEENPQITPMGADFHKPPATRTETQASPFSDAIPRIG